MWRCLRLVLFATHQGRPSGVPPVGRANDMAPVPPVLAMLPAGCWEQLDTVDLSLLLRAAEDCARAHRNARRKTGTSFRRLVAKSSARQFGKVVEAACAPFRFASRQEQAPIAWSTWFEISDDNPMATVLSIDAIGAYDHVQQSAMLTKVHSLSGLRGMPRFIRATYADPALSPHEPNTTTTRIRRLCTKPRCWDGTGHAHFVGTLGRTTAACSHT